MSEDLAYTHDELVLRAGRWLAGTRGCNFVLLEPHYGYPSEIPDAIGWKGRVSVVVEVKVSRPDFFADQHKSSRRADEISLGSEKWYMVPGGLVTPEEVPEGYGLLEIKGKAGRAYRTLHTSPRRRSEQSCLREIKLLAAAGHAIQETNRGFAAYERGKFGRFNMRGEA